MGRSLNRLNSLQKEWGVPSVLDQIDTSWCCLCTDSADPRDLITSGYIVDVVQKVVDLGVSALEALRMVTLNPAEHLGFSHLIGSLASGSYADILILSAAGVMHITGFVTGWGQGTSVVASNLCWDLARIVAIGCSDDDLALAVKTVVDMQVGIVLAVDCIFLIIIQYFIVS